jgi:hypothetical protein
MWLQDGKIFVVKMSRSDGRMGVPACCLGAPSLGVLSMWRYVWRMSGCVLVVIGGWGLTGGVAGPVYGQGQDNSGSKPPVELSVEEVAQGFKLLFDGHSFAGWKGNRSVFRIEDAAVVGGNLNQALPHNEFLRSEQEFENFELRLQFKLVGQQANAGVQIRTAEIPDHHEVIGYQADMGDGWWGCLYDESRRNRVLAGPPAEERDTLVRPGQWNDYRIVCQGARIQLWINGRPTVDYEEADPEISRRGIIALQIHSGPPAEASYRQIRIKVLE